MEFSRSSLQMNQMKYWMTSWMKSIPNWRSYRNPTSLSTSVLDWTNSPYRHWHHTPRMSFPCLGWGWSLCPILCWSYSPRSSLPSTLSWRIL